MSISMFSQLKKTSKRLKNLSYHVVFFLNMSTIFLDLIFLKVSVIIVFLFSYKSVKFNFLYNNNKKKLYVQKMYLRH